MSAGSCCRRRLTALITGLLPKSAAEPCSSFTQSSTTPKISTHLSPFSTSGWRVLTRLFIPMRFWSGRPGISSSASSFELKARYFTFFKNHGSRRIYSVWTHTSRKSDISNYLLLQYKMPTASNAEEEYCNPNARKYSKSKSMNVLPRKHE